MREMPQKMWNASPTHQLRASLHRKPNEKEVKWNGKHLLYEWLLTLDFSSTSRTHSIINSSHYYVIYFRISVPKSVKVLNNWQKQYITWLPLSKTIKACFPLYGQFLAGVKETHKVLPRQTQHSHDLAKLFCLSTWISCSVHLNTPVCLMVLISLCGSNTLKSCSKMKQNIEQLPI